MNAFSNRQDRLMIVMRFAKLSQRLILGVGLAVLLAIGAVSIAMEVKLSGRVLLSIYLVGAALIVILGTFLLRNARLSTRILTNSLSATKAAKASLEADVAARDEHIGAAHSVMESTFNSMAEAVLVIDTKGGIVLSNPAAQQLLGYRNGMTDGDLWLVNSFCRPDGVTQMNAEERPSAI